MIAHISLAVKDFEESLYFYDQTLALLGYQRVMFFGNVAGYGINDKPYFWISDQGKVEESIGRARGFHVAFNAPNQRSVNLWFAQAIELGGIDNGKPGLRKEYHPDYYTAFIIDPNGWRIEAITFNT